MLRPLVRTLVSAVVSACFALSVANWGRPAVCASHALTGSGHHQGSHPAGKHDQPASQTCAVHLCCAHLSAEPPTALAADRLSGAPTSTGLTAATAIPAARPAHALPFAHAPPLLS
jgi:hypothetical protein